MFVDLHIHTDKSDGTNSPLKLLELAKSQQLEFIAFTDHDTVEGIKQATLSGFLENGNSLKLLSGIEISAEYEHGTLHILGYGIDIYNQTLLKQLKKFQDIRRQRNISIVNKLNNLGIDISISDISRIAKNNKSQGRPHIAKALLERGIVKDIDEAFKIFLGKNKKAYVKKVLFTAEEAISIVNESGGKAFIAHPATLNKEGHRLKSFVSKLKEMGLAGLEVFAPLHNQQQVDNFLQLAKKLELFISAGSDFHGSIKPDVYLGKCYAGKKIDSNMISKELLDLHK